MSVEARLFSRHGLYGLFAALAITAPLFQCAPCDPPSAPLQLIVGTGGSDDPSTFTVLRDGVSVALTQGFQGGQHVWIQVRGINRRRRGAQALPGLWKNRHVRETNFRPLSD